MLPPVNVTVSGLSSVIALHGISSKTVIGHGRCAATSRVVMPKKGLVLLSLSPIHFGLSN